MVTGVVPSPPRILPSAFTPHRVQKSHCSSIVHRVLLTHAVALSASQFVHKKKSQRIYTSMHSAGLELTKLTYTRLEDNLIRHRGDRVYGWSFGFFRQTFLQAAVRRFIVLPKALISITPYCTQQQRLFVVWPFPLDRRQIILFVASSCLSHSSPRPLGEAVTTIFTPTT